MDTGWGWTRNKHRWQKTPHGYKKCAMCGWRMRTVRRSALPNPFRLRTPQGTEGVTVRQYSIDGAIWREERDFYLVTKCRGKALRELGEGPSS